MVQLIADDGSAVERVHYSAYGVPFGLHPADMDLDGDVDGADFTKFTALYNGGYHVLVDFNHDGVVDSTDYVAFASLYTAGENLGRGNLSRSTTDNRIGYAGYQWDRFISKYHVRNRVYEPATGRWLTRDPIDYASGSANLYEYVFLAAFARLDPMGLFAVSGIFDGVKDWWHDMRDGVDVVIDYWDDVFTGKRSIQEVIDDSRDPGAIREIQDALACCDYIPGADVITIPLTVGLELWNPDGSIVNACTTTLCSLNPIPGGNKLTPNVGLPPTKGVFPKAPGTGFPIPDPASIGRPHTQVIRKEGRRGVYTQGREWGTDPNCPVRDIDFTDHGRPNLHPNPHQHPWTPTPSGPKRQGPKPFDPKNP